MIDIPGIDPNMIANNLIPSQPTHPGEVLREEIESMGITQTKLANEIGVRVSLLNELIKENPNIRIEELALNCEITRDGVNYQIRKLKEKGILKRIGGDNGGHWEITN